MIRIRKIDHVVLRTENPDDLKSFYCEVLGCSVERELAPEVGLIQLRAGECLIDIVPVDSELGRAGGAAPGADGNNMDHFCLQLEPFDESELIDWLKSCGVGFSEFASRYGAQGKGPSVYLHDPDGNTVELRAVLDE